MNAPAININKPVREQVSKEEWEVRVNLAACFRLADCYGMSDMIYTHISARVPDEPDRFLINPFGMLFGEMTPGAVAAMVAEPALSGRTATPPEVIELRRTPREIEGAVMFGRLGIPELVVIVCIIILIFGASRLHGCDVAIGRQHSRHFLRLVHDFLDR